ncbi:MAG: hypothetical protein NVSMB30_29330 [Hymenobacter sp.]
MLATRLAAASTFDFNVYPNPAQAISTIAYAIPAGQTLVSLAVYNALGQRVRTLNSGPTAGRQLLNLEGLPSGSYLIKLQIGDVISSRKLVVQ